MLSKEILVSILNTRLYILISRIFRRKGDSIRTLAQRKVSPSDSLTDLSYEYKLLLLLDVDPLKQSKDVTNLEVFVDLENVCLS